MHLLDDKIYRLLQATGLLASGEVVVVGVSGGPDSMALLHVLADLADKLGISLVAVYADHGLRPTEARKEVALVEEQAIKLGVKFETAKLKVGDYAREQGVSTEHAARILRYGILKEVAKRHGATKIAVAHTADDQAEELLLRLLRGTARRGLAGMDLQNEANIVRPFLDTPKSELLSYLAECGMPYLEDSSNFERIYLRNRVRLDLLPYLEDNFNPNIRQTLLQTAAILRDEEQLLAEISRKAFADLVRKIDPVNGPESEAVTFDIQSFLVLPLAVQRRVVEMLLITLENTPGFRQIALVLGLATAENGAQIHLACGLRVVKADGHLVFSYPRGKGSWRGVLTEKSQPFELMIDGPGSYWLEQAGLWLDLACLDHVPDHAELKSDQVDYLDLGKISFPLIVRSPQTGDRFHPLGGPGRKKVGDFLTDRKVGRDKRRQVVVIESAGKIVALPNLRIDQGCRVTPETEMVLKVCLRKG